MNVIEGPKVDGPPLGEEMTGLKLLRSRFATWWYIHVSKRIPRLVWLGDEIDARVTFKGIGAIGDDPTAVFDLQQRLNALGITFDCGSGLDGRDWEWDWSLSGPISVTFRGRARNPERRCLPEKPDLKLVS